MKTQILPKTLNSLIIGLSLVLTIANSKPVIACEGASFVENIPLTNTWQLHENINAGTYYVIEVMQYEVVLVSFCQGGAFYENNPMVEISPMYGSGTTLSNDDFCGYGSELLFICETSGFYKIAFYQSGCISDNSELGTVAIKKVPTPTESDCLGAIPLCTEFYEDGFSVNGSGNYYDLHNFNTELGMAVNYNNCPNCLVTGEIRSKWFTFQINQPGNLEFTIDPVENFDDYDFALYKMSDTCHCEDLINYGINPPISCNFAFVQVGFGNTGIGGGYGSCDGPTADSAFNEAIPVVVGEKFILVVTNFSNSSNGFSLDFSDGSASIVDTRVPQLTNIVYEPQCGSNTISIQFSENLLCSEVQATDFVLSGPGGNYEITDAYSNMCEACSVNTYAGVFYDNIWTLVLAEPMSSSGDYTIALQANSIFDNCMNANYYQELYFNIDCPEFYTLTVNTVGNGIVDVDGMTQSETYTIIENSNLAVTAFSEYGWQFDSWSGDLLGTNYLENILMDANKTITATFTESPPIYDTLTIIIEGIGHIEVDGNLYTEPMLVERYSNQSLFAIADDGWQFDHWEDSLTGSNNPQNLFVFANEKVKAVFTEIPIYTLEVSVVGQGIVEVNGVLYESVLNFEENSTIEISATAEDGWYFSHWEDSITGISNPLSFNLDNNKFAKAIFLEIQFYNLEIAVVGQGSVNVNNVLYESVLSIQENSDIDIYANPENGWYFSHWEDSLTGNINPELINIHCNKFIKAVFIEYPDYNLEINIVGMGAVEVNGISYEEITSYTAYTVLMLNSVAYEGWQFSHWEDSLTGTQNPSWVIMFDHRTITAVFTEIPEYYLYINVTGNGEIEINGIIYESPLLIEEGSLLSFKAIPFENYMFSNWAGDLSGNTNPDTVLVQSELNVEAVFLNISNIQQSNYYKYSVSPNPFKESLKISSSNADIETFYHLYSMTGSIIFKGSFFENKTISTDFLKPAMYRLSVDNGEVRQEFKIIKTE